MCTCICVESERKEPDKQEIQTRKVNFQLVTELDIITEFDFLSNCERSP